MKLLNNSSECHADILRAAIILTICLMGITFLAGQQSANEPGKLTVIKSKGMVDVRNGKLIDNAMIFVGNGKIDIIAVDNNPLANIETLELVSFVMKDGKLVKERSSK